MNISDPPLSPQSFIIFLWDHGFFCPRGILARPCECWGLIMRRTALTSCWVCVHSIDYNCRNVSLRSVILEIVKDFIGTCVFSSLNYIFNTKEPFGFPETITGWCRITSISFCVLHQLSLICQRITMSSDP